MERGSSVAGAYCGRILGLLGANVVKIEPRGGDAMRSRSPLLRRPDGRPSSALFEYLNCNKRSVALDDDSDEGRETLRRLASRTDIVVDYSDGDPSRVHQTYSEMQATNPRIVYTAISGFGLTGPYRRFRSNDFLALASGGHLYLTGHPDRHPVQSGGPWAGYAIGTLAASACLVAARRARATGRGQLIDLSAMETLASLHQWTLTLYTHQGYVKRRAGNRMAESYHPISLVECTDGWVSLAVSGGPNWEGFCIAVDMPELLADPRFQSGGDRFDHADELDAIIAPWFAATTVAEAVTRLQAHRVPAGPVVSVPDVLNDEHLQARDFWSPAPHLGEHAKMPTRGFHTPGDARLTLAPQLGQHTEAVQAEIGRAERGPAERRPAERRPAQRGPAERRLTDDRPPERPMFLAGVRVLEFSVAWAGPLAGRFLADFGAEVIHIERSTARGVGYTGLDPARVAEDSAGWEWGALAGPIFRSGIYPDADPGSHPWNRQGIFNKMNRNKRSLCVDLKTEQGREVFIDLVRVSDIVLNNYSPRGVASLGLDYEHLSEYNPRIITVSMSGYGLTGPDSMRVSLGPVLEGHSGLASATGYEDGGPLKMGVAFADPIAALHALAAMLAALDQRDQSGVGTGLDFSQFEAYASIGGELYLEASVTGEAPRRHGNRSPDAAPQGVYRCAGEDSWLAVSVLSDEEWRALAAVLGDEMTSTRYQSLAARLRHHDEIDRVLGAWSGRRDKFAAMRELQRSGVRAVAVMTSRDLVEGEHMTARGFMVEWDQADVGRRRFPGFPIHFEDPSAVKMEGTAALGADNESILREILGYPSARIQALVDSGVLATRPPEGP